MIAARSTRPLSRSEREQLVRLRREPHEAPWKNTTLNLLRKAGLADMEPLQRPSGYRSRYCEWFITDRGVAELEKQA